MTLHGHNGEVVSLAEGPNGKMFSGSTDRTIMVWSSENGAHVQTLVGHTGTVYALAIGRDGKVYSGSQDTTVRTDHEINNSDVPDPNRLSLETLDYIALFITCDLFSLFSIVYVSSCNHRAYTRVACHVNSGEGVVQR